MGRRHHRYSQPGGFWRQEVGGAPYWFIAAALALMLVLAGIVLFTPHATPTAYTPKPRPAATAATDAPATPALSLPGAGATVLFFGDSWTAGYSADPESGYAWLSANANGWTPDVHGHSGSGYVYGGPTGVLFQEAFDALPASAPALVILQGGINDAGQPGDVKATAQAMFESAKAKYPDAQIVVLGPGTADWPIWEPLKQTDSALAEAARASGLPYISPIQAGWFTAENYETIIDQQTRHPGAEGHAYLAGRLGEALNTLAVPD